MKQKTQPIFRVTEVYPRPVVTKGDAGTEGNRYGFEGGRALKLDGEYHVFTTEMSGQPVWTRTRLAHWKSEDGLAWKRISTVAESNGNFDGADTHASLWSPMPTFDNEQQHWVLTYVCYRSHPEIMRNYDGRIAMAVSETAGEEGIDGPYQECSILMAPGKDSAPWEGIMGVNSFFPYRTDSGWLAWYGGQRSKPRSVEGDDLANAGAAPRATFVADFSSMVELNGLARAPRLAGPWQRLSVDAPASECTENPVVTRLKDGRYVAFFDGCFVHQSIGYMVSMDGRAWSEPVLIDLSKHPHMWWGLTRTPLGLIEEDDGRLKLFFTAYNLNWYDIVASIGPEWTDAAFDPCFASIGLMELELVL